MEQMSFQCDPLNALNVAIDSAVVYGRNNKGCILVAASGNDNLATVNYPASLNNVIAVGAISQCGTRKRKSSDPARVSCDGETDWGSNYGTALDVVAPGVKIYTTDLQGDAGNNNASGTAGDYYASFNGTSSACPHVAGVAALVLSVNPNLTGQQVRNVIESTAQKVGGYSYVTTSGRPNGTWINQMGYGLVNAYAAVQAVCATIPPPANFINQIVTTNTNVTHCGDINVANVTVTNNAKLTLQPAGDVIFTGDLDLTSGTELEIK